MWGEERREAPTLPLASPPRQLSVLLQPLVWPWLTPWQPSAILLLPDSGQGRFPHGHTQDCENEGVQRMG